MTTQAQRVAALLLQCYDTHRRAEDWRTNMETQYCRAPNCYVTMCPGCAARVEREQVYWCREHAK